MRDHSDSAAHTATFSADDPAIPAPAGDSHDVVSVMPRASKKWASSDNSRSSRLSRERPPVVGFDRGASVHGVEHDAVVGPALDQRVRAQADRDVDRLSVGMEEIERPDVEGAARQIDASRRGSRYAHHGIIEPAAHVSFSARPSCTQSATNDQHRHRRSDVSRDTASGRERSQRLSWWILLGLVERCCLRACSSSPPVRRCSSACPPFVEPIGTLWVNAIRMTVIPLLISLVITAVASSVDASSATRVGGRSMVLFVAMVVLSMVFALLTAPLALLPLQVERERGRIAACECCRGDDGGTVACHFATGSSRSFPLNPIQAAAEGAVLPVLVFSLLFGLAASRISL